MDKRCLFLTSCGLTDETEKIFFMSLKKEPKNIRIIFIPTAGIETDGAREGIALCLDELAKMGIHHENIFIYNLELLLSKEYMRTYSAHIGNPAMVSRLLTLDEIMTFDAIFVSGGDCTVLCREMVRTGFDEVLYEAINRGLVYVGISAGSMYAAGNMDNGLHIISNSIIPHWCGEKESGIQDGYMDIHLADGQTVLINSGKIEIVC